MSALPPTNISPELAARELLRAARLVERLKTRRRKLVKQLREVEDQLSVAGRALRTVARDVTQPEPGSQTTLADLDAEPLPDRTVHQLG